MWANLFIGRQSRALWVFIPRGILHGFLAFTFCEPGEHSAQVGRRLPPVTLAAEPIYALGSEIMEI